jgi:plasmid stabilization system protein ParE
MAYKIIQSKIFLKRVIELNIYLEKKWGLQVAKRFQAKLVKTIFILSGNPGIGSLSKKKDVHKILVTKHNRLYYKISDNSIILLTLFDTRLNPKKNNFE